MFTNLFQTLTKSLSIKGIVISGVVIMGIVVMIFSATMIFFTFTVKYDKETLKTIIVLEEQNNNILKDVNLIHSLNANILTSNSSSFLNKLKVVDTVSNYENLDKKIDIHHKYNDKINELRDVLEQKLLLQKKLYNSKEKILKNKNRLNLAILDINKKINKIKIVADSIEGRVLLKNKRILRKLKNNSSKIFQTNIYNEIEKVQELTKNLNISILKLPSNIFTIITTNNIHVVNHIYSNILNQINQLIDNIYIDLSNDRKFYQSFQDDLEIFKNAHSKIKTQQKQILKIKKLILYENEELVQLVKKSKSLEVKIFDEIEAFSTISNEIKFTILNKSDLTAEKITYVVIAVGILSSIILILSASILIARINIPLEFITHFISEIGLKNKTISNKIPVEIDDELGQLSVSFNNMTSTIEDNIGEIKDLYQEIENTQKEIIFTMGAAGELRSKETGMHVKRVAEYSKTLALYYGLSNDDAELLKLASPMHDIGKVGIPDAILHKPGKLDFEEFKIMKTHAQLGYSMLKGSKRIILKSASIVAHEHHEKYDGSGYPRGLKGEGIHIFGRITAVADVFDALGSERSYKKAWDDEKILELFKEQSGKHFDPRLIEIFLKNKEVFYKIRDKYKEEL